MTLHEDMLCTNNNKNGSVTLETAIAFTVTLVLFCALISVISFYRAGILMQRSVEQACEEISILPPTTVLASDALSTVVNAFPDIKASDSKGSLVLQKVAATVIGVDSFTGYTVENLVLEGTLAHVMANNIRHGYIVRNNNSEFFAPESIDVDLNVKSEKHLMEVVCSYDTLTLFGRVKRVIYSAVPLYGDFSLWLNPEKSSGEYDIWSEDNFTRGDYFRDKYSSNLPKTFPVIDSYSNGVCESIVSIDLTAPTYSSYSRLSKKMTDEIDALADFDGADVTISGSHYRVRSEDIVSKRLKVIIPSNSDDGIKQQLQIYSGYASLRGIELEVEEYGESHRFTSQNEPIL